MKYVSLCASLSYLRGWLQSSKCRTKLTLPQFSVQSLELVCATAAARRLPAKYEHGLNDSRVCYLPTRHTVPMDICLKNTATFLYLEPERPESRARRISNLFVKLGQCFEATLQHVCFFFFFNKPQQKSWLNDLWVEFVFLLKRIDHLSVCVYLHFDSSPLTSFTCHRLFDHVDFINERADEPKLD